MKRLPHSFFAFDCFKAERDENSEDHEYKNFENCGASEIEFPKDVHSVENRRKLAHQIHKRIFFER